MFARLAILAPGLLGGSVALAARHCGVAREVAVWARRPEVRQDLRQQPWGQAVADTPGEAVRGADLVVVCSPVDSIVPLVQEIAPVLATGALGVELGF